MAWPPYFAFYAAERKRNDTDMNQQRSVRSPLHVLNGLDQEQRTLSRSQMMNHFCNGRRVSCGTGLRRLRPGRHHPEGGRDFFGPSSYPAAARRKQQGRQPRRADRCQALFAFPFSPVARSRKMNDGSLITDPADALEELAVVYPVELSEDNRWLLVHDFLLPPGYDRKHIDILMQIPPDYPISPPGVGDRIYLPADLRFRGRELASFYRRQKEMPGNWAWFCYNQIQWDIHQDNLIGFLEMIRADLTNPKTV